MSKAALVLLQEHVCLDIGGGTASPRVAHSIQTRLPPTGNRA